MKILAFDTSAKVGAVAVCDENEILSESFVNTRLTHSQTLMPICESVLENAKLSLEEIGLFAVSAGPGSFTGLRIGIAAVKGLAQAMGKPCAAVSTLWALGWNLMGFDGVACAVMDARCNQVYNAMFELKDGRVNRLCGDRALSVSELEDELFKIEKKIFLVGDGAELCYNHISKSNRIILAPPLVRYQHASSVAFCGFEVFSAGQAVTADGLAPSYLRLPQAERMLLEKQKGEIKL